MRSRWLAAAVLLVAPAVLPACGGGGSNSAKCPAPADSRAAVNGAITICAFDPFRFDVKQLTAPAGTLNITFINKGASTHTFTLENPKFELSANGFKTKSGTVTLTKGTYQFKCSFDSHAANGMHGTLVVS